MKIQLFLTVLHSYAFTVLKERSGVMKKLILLIISIFTITLSICQTSNKELPISFLYNLPTNIETYHLNAQLTRIQNETRIEVIEGDTLDFSDPIIGELFSVPININTIGTWTVLDNGDSIWQLQINSTAGTYMMLCFDDFYLPYGTKLFVYAADRSQTYGPFTDENNYPSRKFSTAPLKTNSLIMEYYKPSYVREQAALNVQSVGLIQEDFGTGFGDSDPCMINAMCPEYNSWCNQRRSVALIIRVQSYTIRKGTGSLLTNEKRDGKPFFLTAFHVVDTDGDGSMSQSEIDELQNWVFVFNYQSPGCSNPTIEPSFEYFISGAAYIRGYWVNTFGNGPDYALLQLNQKPPKNYNVYYNGWSNDNDDMTETGVTIHHPKCDIKKIAVWKKRATGGTVSWWRVQFTEGGTQVGSSGAPLFNDSGYVVGQLNSGIPNHPCGSSSRGTYGRFSRAWHNYGLHYELNPSGKKSGGNDIDIISMSGDESCKQDWYFNNCDDLHTSDNIGVELFQQIRQYDGVYNAKNQIKAENTIIQSGTRGVVFEAGNQIILKPGFHAKAGSNFIAKIGDCERGCNNGKSAGIDDYEMIIFNSDTTDIIQKSMPVSVFENNDKVQEFTIYPNPNRGIFSIQLSNEKSELQRIMITDVRGIVVYNNNDTNTVINEIQLPNPVPGIYIISLYFKDKILTSKFAVL
jgi:hypothetical protein